MLVQIKWNYYGLNPQAGPFLPLLPHMSIAGEPRLKCVVLAETSSCSHSNPEYEQSRRGPGSCHQSVARSSQDPFAQGKAACFEVKSSYSSVSSAEQRQNVLSLLVATCERGEEMAKSGSKGQL